MLPTSVRAPRKTQRVDPPRRVVDPNLYVGCSASSGLGDCSRFTSYRVERWDPVTASYTTLAEGKTGDAAFYMDMSVNEDRLGLYYYRVVRLGASGAEVATRSTAYGIWDSWL